MESFKETEKPETISVRQSLILATLDTIKQGIKLDDTELQAAAARDAQKAKKKMIERRGGGHRKIIIKKEEEAAEEENRQRTYRAHEDRRFGLMIVGDIHHHKAKTGVAFRGKGKSDKDSADAERLIFPEEPPLDFSFCLLNTVEEIISEQEPPQTVRNNYKMPRKTRDDRYITSSLRLSYNVIQNFDGFVNILYKILDTGPFGLCWLDLSFNSVNCMDEDTFTQLPNLCILYLHGNRIADMLEVQKLRGLPALHSLTLHGNPIEQDETYRVTVLHYMPNLKHLDYFPVIKSDKVSARIFGSKTQSHWEKKHVELLSKAKVLKETLDLSVTERLMKEIKDWDYTDD